MEYINGGNLSDNLKQVEKFSEDQAKFIIAQMVIALEHLHSKDVLHRDIKAENVLMRENGYIVLADYGLSKMIEDYDTAVTFCGTKEYMAPEIYKRQPQDKAVDWWAVGILTFELLAGYTPFGRNEYMIRRGTNII